MPTVIIPLTITADEYLKVYKGSGKNVYAQDIHGRSVQFPAKILQPFVTRTGIAGLFEITVDRHGKYQSIRLLNG